MTTQYYNTPLIHTNDTEFRAWAQALHNALIAVGLVQTADTGQVNLTTMTRPAVYTMAGFIMYRFNDALQSTAPVFIRIDYGTDNVATRSDFRIRIGNATDGAGTFTGTLLTAASLSALRGGNDVVSNVTNYPTYVCGLDGYVAVAFKIGSMVGDSGKGLFSVMRTCDASGAPNGDGVVLYTTNGSTVPVAQAISFVAATVTSSNNVSYCLVPFGQGTSVVGADIQLYKHYAPAPRLRCNPFLLTYDTDDITIYTDITVTPVGSTPHNYKTLGPCATSAGSGASAQHGLAMVYE